MSTDLTDAVEGIVHEPTQTEGKGLDLTLADVYEIDRPARIDFGGGEQKPPERTPVPTERRNPDDEYGWYNLEAGQYLVSFNESLVSEETFWLQIREAVRSAGAIHPSLRVDRLEEVPFVVGDPGIRLKENARISTLFRL